jgi:hypothetical protein
VTTWANHKSRAWAFTACNAGAKYVNCFNDLAQLDEVNWSAVEATDFREPAVKEGKQAEFLIHESFPWQLIERIGVQSEDAAQMVRKAIAAIHHQPAVVVERNWYY